MSANNMFFIGAFPRQREDAHKKAVVFVSGRTAKRRRGGGVKPPEPLREKKNL